MKKLLLLAALLLAMPSFGQGIYSPLDTWKGEYLQPGNGGIYTRIFLRGFPTKGISRNTSNIFLHSRDAKSGRRMVINQAGTLSESEPLIIWKIPVGDFEVEKITFNDTAGITRIWGASGKPRFSTRPLFLSNLGDISISPFKRQGLAVKFTPRPNRFKNSFGHQSFAGVIDAYTTKVQVKLGGQKVLQGASQSFGSADEARSVFSTTRQISMYYKLEAAGSDSTIKSISRTLNATDGDLRRCYMDQLDAAAGLRGNVVLSFQLPSGRSPFTQVRPQGGSLASAKVVECLALTLARTQVASPQAVRGRLIFTFDYKEDIGRSRPF